MEVTRNRIVAAFFFRTLLGLIFLMQGWGKIMKFGFEGLGKMFASYKETFLPSFLVDFTMYFTTYAELVGGFLLVIGLFRNYAYYALAVVLLMVSFGHGLTNPIWDLQHVIFRAILLGTCLLLPETWDQWQTDRLFRKK